MNKQRKLFVKLTPKIDILFTKMNRGVHDDEHPSIQSGEHDNDIKNDDDISDKNNVNVGFQSVDNCLSPLKESQLEYHLRKINDLANKRVWLQVIKQIGFYKTIEILIDVGESETANNKGACAIGKAKKIGYKPKKRRI